jgi:hypothetical protein
VSYLENDAGSSSSSSDSVVEGLSGRAAQPRPVTPSASRPIPIPNNGLRTVLGSGELNATDAAFINSDRGLSAALNANDAADEAFSGSFSADVARSSATPPVLTAMNGNWSEEADEFGLGRYTNSIFGNLNTDDRATFMQYFTKYSFGSSSSG